MHRPTTSMALRGIAALTSARLNASRAASYWSFLQLTTHSPAVVLAEAMPPAQGSKGLRPLQAQPLAEATGLPPSGQRKAMFLVLCGVGLQTKKHCLRSIVSCRMPSTQTLSETAEH